MAKHTPNGGDTAAAVAQAQPLIFVQFEQDGLYSKKTEPKSMQFGPYESITVLEWRDSTGNDCWRLAATDAGKEISLATQYPLEDGWTLCGLDSPEYSRVIFFTADHQP
jgi:hypothetical protein